MAENSRRYIVLCQHGQKRSPTGAGVLRRMLDDFGRKQDYVTFGAYSSFEAAPEKRVKHINSFDEIFVMAEYMRLGLAKAGISERKISCFNIEDEDAISRNNPALIREFEDKFLEYFKNRGLIGKQ